MSIEPRSLWAALWRFYWRPAPAFNPLHALCPFEYYRGGLFKDFVEGGDRRVRIFNCLEFDLGIFPRNNFITDNGAYPNLWYRGADKSEHSLLTPSHRSSPFHFVSFVP